MRRIHLFELEDQGWLPKPIRDAGTDFLRFALEAAKVYDPIVPRLRDALTETQSREILDLGSGGGGPIIGLHKQMVEAGGVLSVTLTDKFPNRAAFEYARKRSSRGVDFVKDSVDATAVPPNLSGFRTLFTSFHHFRPAMARRILQNAVDQGQPIGVFEISRRSIPPPRFVLLTNPFGVLLSTPFVRPFRFSRLLWTYLIPVVPFFIMWDGFVSGLRAYSVQELQDVVEGLRPNDYVWQIGREPDPHSSITYLIGYPKSKAGLVA